MPDKNPYSRKTISRRSFLRRAGGFLANHWVLSTLGFGGAGAIAWVTHDTLGLKIEQWDLFYPNLPTSLEGKTIVQLSDLHLEILRISPESLSAPIIKDKPDILVITGDLISDRQDLYKVASYLNPLQARYGRYIIMGNNDYSNFSKTLFKRYLELLLGLGWVPLLNDSEFISSLDLWVIGVDDPASAHDDVPKAYSKLEKGESKPFRLVLSHSTDCFDDVAKFGADLFLTGHTHGGQIRLPGLEPFVKNTLLAHQGVYEGLHIIDNIPVYVNRGIGESIIPLRLNVPPEITYFKLKRGSTPAKHKSIST